VAGVHAWQAFAVKVLTEGGRNQDSHINRLYGIASGCRCSRWRTSSTRCRRKARTTGARITDLRRRIANSILPEGGTRTSRS
jgi:hypothetical protein